MNLGNSAKIFFQLIYRDLLILKGEIVSFVLDSLAWPTRAILVWGYIMSNLGLASGYGMFYFAGMLASAAIMKTMYGLSRIFSDIEGNRFIDYELTLAVNPNFVFIRKALIFSVNLLILGFVILPVGLLLLWPQLAYLNLNIPKFLLMYLLICLMVGFATLWLAGWVKNSSYIGSIWSRYIHTLWLFGCMLYPWKLFFSMFPFWALVNLFNPVTYAMEGIRGSMLNPSDYINYWICVIAISFYTIFFAVRGLSLLKKRFDVA